MEAGGCCISSAVRQRHSGLPDVPAGGLWGQRAGGTAGPVPEMRGAERVVLKGNQESGVATSGLTISHLSGESLSGLPRDCSERLVWVGSEALEPDEGPLGTFRQQRRRTGGQVGPRALPAACRRKGRGILGGGGSAAGLREAGGGLEWVWASELGPAVCGQRVGRGRCRRGPGHRRSVKWAFAPL